MDERRLTKEIYEADLDGNQIEVVLDIDQDYPKPASVYEQFHENRSTRYVRIVGSGRT
jgi:hypothetical protein